MKMPSSIHATAHSRGNGELHKANVMPTSVLQNITLRPASSAAWSHFLPALRIARALLCTRLRLWL